MSPPARVAWIEIAIRLEDVSSRTVATREGGVDRNTSFGRWHIQSAVATREGGVDRNVDDLVFDGETNLSPPARVAWIEIFNLYRIFLKLMSPPARVAWIEMICK